VLPSHDLDQAHHRCRVEEVHPDDALGVGRRGGDRGHEERRGVGREHAVRDDDARELGERALLEFE